MTIYALVFSNLKAPTHPPWQKKKKKSRSYSGLTSDTKLGATLHVYLTKAVQEGASHGGQPEQHSVFHKPGNLPLEMTD